MWEPARRYTSTRASDLDKRSIKRAVSRSVGRSILIGSSDGDCAPSPSHTTGDAVFRIRRLNPGTLLPHPQPPQVPLPSLSFVPSQPEALSNVPSDPTLQFQEWPPHLSQLEVRPPASDVPVPVVPQLRTRAAASTVPLLAYLRFESLQTLRCYSNPLLAIQSKPQELTFPDPPCSALNGVHLQSQILLDPPLYRAQRCPGSLAQSGPSVCRG